MYGSMQRRALNTATSATRITNMKTFKALKEEWRPAQGHVYHSKTNDELMALEKLHRPKEDHQSQVHADIARAILNHRATSRNRDMKEGISHQVPVYHADRKTLVGHVHSGATSIGAAKLAKKKSATFSRVNGVYSWVASADLKESEQLDEISQGLATKVYKARVGKMARALKKGDEATAEKHFNKSQQTADRMSNKPSFDVKKGIRDLSEESEQLDEISKSLSLAVGKKRLEQGKHFQNAVSKWGLNPKHSEMYAKKADEYFGKSKKAYEYAFNKGVTKGKELEESAWDIYRRQALTEASLNVKTLSAEEIAQKHGVSLDTIKDQIAKGIRVEHEHATSDQTAEEIARDHLGERPDYYEKLDKANLEEADLKAQWNTDFRKDSYARRKNLSRTIKQQLNPKTPGLGNKAWKRADKEERENRKSTVSASLHESATTSTSGMSFKEAIAHATKHGGKIVFGTNSQKWHSISPEDRDYNMPHASDPQDAQKVGEKQAMWGVRSVARSIVNRKPPKWRTLTNPMQTVTELHDEPDRPGTGIGVSGDGTEKGMAMTEDGPSKKKTISKADWDHHTRHATAQFDTDGQRWIVQQDATGAAVRIPVTVTEDYPYRQTIRRILREAFPMAPKSTEKPDNTQDDEEKGEAPKVKKEKAVDPVVIGKTKDKFEADPVLTPVLSVANMPGGSVR